MTNTTYNEFDYNKYLALEDSDIFQNLIRYTIEVNLPNLKNKKVYDVGSGTGFCAKFLSQYDIKSYLGMDLTEQMTPHIKNFVCNNISLKKMNFVIGDALNKNLIHESGPFDLITNSCCIYASDYEELLDLCLHMYRNLTPKVGELILVAYHIDFLHSKQRMAVFEKYGIEFSKILAENEHYKAFEKINFKLKRPYYKNVIEFNDEPVITKENMLKALNESGFKNINVLDFIVKPGHEHLFEIQRNFGVTIYKCLKNN